MLCSSMLRFIIRKQKSWRTVFTAASRFSVADTQNSNQESSKDVSPILGTESISSELPKINWPVPNPPSLTPFAELDRIKERSEDQYSDIGEYVDSLSMPPPVSFNLAAFVNESDTLQKLVQLGVDLYAIEQKPENAKFLLSLDFEQNIKGHIRFLHDIGVHADDLGWFITKNPLVFQECLEDMETRVNYLRSKKFNSDAIARIVTRCPIFLNMQTLKVDSRLGFFQKQFSLTGDEVRKVITMQPKLVIYPFEKLREKLFSLKEEMGFSSAEMKQIFVTKPKFIILGTRSLKERFHVVHNIMGLSHSRIVESPEIFFRRSFQLKQRHMYLVHIKHDQYDPKKPMYVSLFDLATTTDSEFCKRCAKTSVEQYNEFLRTI